jgi:mRNA interferase HigB
MKVVGRNVLDEFGQTHADVSSQINSWLCEVEDAKWQSPADLKRRYPHASILSDNRVIFNLKGNHYRLETKISYTMQIVFLKRMGTHAEYSKWKL